MRYLFISAHTDDLELCCGATINKLVRQGNEIHVRILSHIYDDMDLWNECESAMSVLNVSYKSIDAYPVRIFQEHRQSILQSLYDINKELMPDVIFTHSANDIHADHKTVAEESLRVFKHQNLITFQAEWNTLQSESNYFIEVSEDNMATKIAAMDCYKSQQHRYYFNRQFTYSRALLAGAKIGVKYAEPFRIINLRG